jgi:hypothetical protein
MNCWQKLDIAQSIIQKHFLEKITLTQRHANRPVLKFIFFNNITLYIRFNDYGEYSYQIIYSHDKYDRIRFDNFDGHWNVSSKPHHFHIRWSTDVAKSPMIGDPKEDMVKLFPYIK